MPLNLASHSSPWVTLFPSLTVDVSLTHSFSLIDSVHRFITKRYRASVSSDSTSAPSMTPGLWTIVWIPAVIFCVSHALIRELPGLMVGLFVP